MKGIVTFTLAAGVAITATSIAHAEGVVRGKAAANNQNASVNQGPATIGALNGLVFDRVALNRELSKLQPDDSDLIESTDESIDDSATPIRMTRKSNSVWTY